MKQRLDTSLSRIHNHSCIVFKVNECPVFPPPMLALTYDDCGHDLQAKFKNTTKPQSSTFFRSSGFPFLTQASTISPTQAAGSLLLSGLNFVLDKINAKFRSSTRHHPLPELERDTTLHLQKVCLGILQRKDFAPPPSVKAALHPQHETIRDPMDCSKRRNKYGLWYSQLQFAFGIVFTKCICIWNSIHKMRGQNFYSTKLQGSSAGVCHHPSNSEKKLVDYFRVICAKKCPELFSL